MNQVSPHKIQVEIHNTEPKKYVCFELRVSLYLDNMYCCRLDQPV